MDNEPLPQPLIPEPQEYLPDYTRFLDAQHPCAGLLHPVLAKLPGIFELGVGGQTVPTNKINLQIFTREHADTNSNLYVYKFEYPGVSWQDYCAVSTDPHQQLKLDSNLSDYEIRSLVDETTLEVYLAYKKVLFVSARDFYYVRHQLTAQDGNWVITTSKPGQEEYEGRVRANIIMTASRFVERDGNLCVSVFSHVDMKLKMKPAATKPKGMLEIRKILQRQFDTLLMQKNPI